ncbi:hypothetical protein SAMN02745673_02467 [Marinactinospora thermotolerans DSM 45154]|uniref:Uncharacterized protein n=1 Tax=Marinactinospora thermotolerans DSM 45154 TaxID=1122192 RepID=A0A1T4R2V6_9ACTN|nr:hypothetical protein [Marinactinospora thermotolerans]SKA10384.1 hypothetical protein SAMN02745673_02467 [Marinactinospora thermotolerans DSM 45154]
MKFELVDPVGWDTGTPAHDPGPAQQDDLTPASVSEPPQQPAERLRTTAARLNAHVRREAGVLDATLARLMERVAALEPAMTDSGQPASPPPPSGFRAGMFAASGH